LFDESNVAHIARVVIDTRASNLKVKSKIN